MNVLIIGGRGTVGQAVVKELEQRHTIIIAGRQNADVEVDITDVKSIEAMYQKVKDIDAVIVTAGQIHFAEFSQMTTEDYHLGLNSKLMGQVNVVLVGRKYVKDEASFTLTSGVLSEDPIRTASSGAMVNAAINGFVIGAAIEMPKKMRINAVSPTIVTESLPKLADYFPGFVSVPAARVALAYSKSVEGLQTGQVYKAGY